MKGVSRPRICVKCGQPIGSAIAAWVGDPPKHPTGMCSPVPRANPPEAGPDYSGTNALFGDPRYDDTPRKREHRLKTWPGLFAGLADGSKTAEVRWNDRKFAVGDVLILREFDAESDEFTGRQEVRTVSRVDDLRLVTGRSGFVLLSFEEERARFVRGKRP